MDYPTARQFLIDQGRLAGSTSEPFLLRLKQGKPPIPGQVTAILLALKVVFEALRDANSLERELVSSLYVLASESRQQFEAGQKSGIDWPPLLNEDLARIASAVKSIFVGNWNG